MEKDKDQSSEIMRLKARESRYKQVAESQIADLTKSLEEGQAKNQELENKIQGLQEALKAALDKSATLDKENRQLRESNDKHALSKKSLLEEIESLKKESQQSQTNESAQQKKLAEAEAKNQKLTKEIENLKNTAQEAEALQNALQQKLSETLVKNQELEKKIKRVEGALLGLNSRCDNLDKENKRLSSLVPKKSSGCLIFIAIPAAIPLLVYLFT